MRILLHLCLSLRSLTAVHYDHISGEEGTRTPGLFVASEAISL